MSSSPLLRLDVDFIQRSWIVNLYLNLKHTAHAHISPLRGKFTDKILYFGTDFCHLWEHFLFWFKVIYDWTYCKQPINNIVFWRYLCRYVGFALF